MCSSDLANIAYYEKQAQHPVYGRSAKEKLMGLYDQQVLLQRRKKTLEKNAEAYRRAVARGPGNSSDSGKSSRSSRSSKSSKSSASSAPAENGWWCSCGVLNYTDPASQYFCWGCDERAFDETTCWWALDPHPDDTSPWEIDMANPTANADNNPQ